MTYLNLVQANAQWTKIEKKRGFFSKIKCVPLRFISKNIMYCWVKVENWKIILRNVQKYIRILWATYYCNLFYNILVAKKRHKMAKKVLKWLNLLPQNRSLCQPQSGEPFPDSWCRCSRVWPWGGLDFWKAGLWVGCHLSYYLRLLGLLESQELKKKMKMLF